MDFLTWKENEEEMTTTYYVQCTGKRAFSDNGNEEEKGKLYVYVPKFILYPANYRYRYYYSCCRDGKARQNIWTKRKSNEQRGQGCKKPSRKLNKTCISRIYATQSSNDGRIHVISAHTNHSLSIEDEAKNIPLPKTTQREISAKLQKGIPVERIMEGKNSRITCT